MLTKNRNYTIEFKQKAVELSYPRGNVSEICKDLKVPTSVLQHQFKKLCVGNRKLTLLSL